MITLLILTLMLIIEGIFIFLFNLWSKDKFKNLCEAFRSRFDYLPKEVLIYSYGGFLFTFMRDSFFMYALIFEENSFYTRNIKKEELIFIKSLPSSSTGWLKFKWYFMWLGIITFLSFIVYSFYLKILP